MFEVLQLLEHGDFSDGTHGHALLSCRLNPYSLDRHELSVILEVSRLVHRPVGSVADDVDLLVAMNDAVSVFAAEVHGGPELRNLSGGLTHRHGDRVFGCAGGVGSGVKVQQAFPLSGRKQTLKQSANATT